MPHPLQPPAVAAVLLAAGRSTRMGQPKQLLRLGETTMLEATLANVQQSAVSEIVLVLGAAAEAIQTQIQASHLTIVLNPTYQEGMASSLRAGVRALSPQTEAALIVLADQPFVRPETLDHLIAEYTRTRRPILIPTWQGTRGNPVLIGRPLFPEVMELQGDAGCRAIFGRHPNDLLHMEVNDEGILQDIDNPEDYHHFRAGFPPRTGG